MTFSLSYGDVSLVTNSHWIRILLLTTTVLDSFLSQIHKNTQIFNRRNLSTNLHRTKVKFCWEVGMKTIAYKQRGVLVGLPKRVVLLRRRRRMQYLATATMTTKTTAIITRSPTTDASSGLISGAAADIGSTSRQNIPVDHQNQLDFSSERPKKPICSFHARCIAGSSNLISKIN